MKSVGIHILVEFYDCNKDVLNDPLVIETEMVKAAELIEATVVSSSSHTFSPHGVSAVVVIAESHLTMHTWPEHGYAAVDLFFCTKAIDPWIAIDHLNHILGAQKSTSVEFKRGSFSNMTSKEHENGK